MWGDKGKVFWLGVATSHTMHTWLLSIKVFVTIACVPSWLYKHLIQTLLPPWAPHFMLSSEVHFVRNPPTPEVLPPTPEVLPPTPVVLPPTPEVLPSTPKGLPPTPVVLPPTPEVLPPTPGVLPKALRDALPNYSNRTELTIQQKWSPKKNTM